MSNLVLFKNKGEIELATFKTMGVSVKDGDQPIGYFGTGLKFAIAVILRNGGEVTICSGLDIYSLQTKAETIRGKLFGVVTCNGESLGYTDQLGKNWELWQAYRELLSNARDEGGDSEIVETIEPQTGETRIYINHSKIREIEATKKRQIFIASEPIESNCDCEIHNETPGKLYYRGVFVEDIKSIRSYNILSRLTLTEDRSPRYRWEYEAKIREVVCSSSDVDVFKSCYVEGTLEYDLDHYLADCPSDEFIDYAIKRSKTDRRSIPKGILRLLYQRKRLNEFDFVEMTDKERRQLETAQRVTEAIGYPLNYPVKLVETLGSSTLATVNRDTEVIILSRRIFQQGTKQLASCLLEEIIHLREGLDDCTTNMQSYLFDLIVTLAEEKIGETL